MLQDSQLDLLAEHGWVTVCPMLGQDAVAHARAACQHLAVQPAAISHGARRRIDRSQRQDLTIWLPEPDANDPFGTLRDALETLRQQLNRTLYLGLHPPTVQVALYPPDGAFYRRHLDALPGSIDRRITCIWYLNPDWEPVHGGQLVLHTGPDTTVTVEPRADQAVIFLSDQVEHEVLPSYHPRWAITAWFPSRPPTLP